MEIKKIRIQDWNDYVSDYLSNKKECLFYCIQEQTEVSYGFENDCNIEWCEQNNIPVYDLKRSGGCIVHSYGGFGIVMVYDLAKYKKFVISDLINKFASYLLIKGLNVEIKNNDVTVDGYKVASAGEHQYDVPNRWGYGTMQISINQDLEVIEHACKKPMVKIPKGLSEWEITTEEIKNWLLETVSKL